MRGRAFVGRSALGLAVSVDLSCDADGVLDAGGVVDGLGAEAAEWWVVSGDHWNSHLEMRSTRMRRLP